jgi:ribonuclease P protein component
MKHLGFGKHLRLLRSNDFQQVFDHRASRGDRLLVVYGRPVATSATSPTVGESRLGLVVSRRVGNAVRRNRWKRVLREVFRQHRTALPRGYDWVVIPRAGSTPETMAVTASLLRLTAQVARLESRRREDRPQVDGGPPAAPGAERG